MVLPDAEIKKLVLKGGHITEAELAGVVDFTKKTKTPLAEALIKKELITEEVLGRLIADYYKIPFVNLSKLTITPEVAQTIPVTISRRNKLVVFERTADSVKVALSDPTNTEMLQMIAKKTGLKAVGYYSSEKDIDITLQLYRKDIQKTINELLSYAKTATAAKSDAPIVKIVDELIYAAYQDKASDIHIEPEKKDSLIRFRIDGVLHDVLRLQKILHDRVVTRIKVLSDLRTDEHLSAQDGKMRMALSEEDLDLRVSIIPIVDGEKVVLRLLSSKSRQYSLGDLGMSDGDLNKLTKALNSSHGMILSTGPTGSGKTTTIYTILKILNTREKNITTIEDPVEYKILGTNQIQVNERTKLTFARGLRSILRQDPNIIFVGEIRDSETAGIGVNAALTGHLVLSTLHTNDAATSMPRLIDMKVESYLVASTVNIIIAQRLVRKICEYCKASKKIPRAELVKDIPEEVLVKYFGSGDILVYYGEGCKMCGGTGYSGRLGLYEVLEITKSIRKLITQKIDADLIKAAAIKEGMKTIMDDGLAKVAAGSTTIEEVLRVARIESSAENEV